MKWIIQESLFGESPEKNPLPDEHNASLFNSSIDSTRIPSGWYTDGQNSNFLRYWNGREWTGERRLRKSWMRKP